MRKHDSPGCVWRLQIDLVFLGDSITIKWNEYPAAFWCKSFSTGDACTSNVRPIFERYFGVPYNAVAYGVAGKKGPLAWKLLEEQDCYAYLGRRQR